MAITKRSQFILPLTTVIGLHTLPSIVMAQTPSRVDLNLDGIPNRTYPDIDNDGILNGLDRNIDGGTAQVGPLLSSAMRG
jgi:hypothetical protein